MTAQARLLGGRYQVGELLGYGGMAEVHRGRDLRLGRDVAIKMLRADLARDVTFQERFRREAQNAAALNHPAIVAVYDTGEETGATGERLPFIVMEFVSGRTLKEVLAAEQRLMPRRALEIIADVCAALEFSHRHGIIHRDIKPGNIMLTQNGQVKVMDFGIARALASGATTMTQTSAVIGTAQYLSPEQARGEAVDARSDVYAAGCVLFELVCGHPPFVGDSPVSVAYQHVREDPRTPSDINPEVPPAVDAIVLKALAKNPLNRYQSAQEMRADALRAVSGRPVLATPVMTEAETIALTSSRMPAGPTRTIPATVAGGPGGGQRRGGGGWWIAVLAALGVLAAIALGVGLFLTNNAGKDIPVPDLSGKTAEQAQAILAPMKLRGQAGDPIKNNDCTQDQIVKQDPPAQTKVAADSIVTYQVCGGPNQVQVPDLAGYTKAAAQDALQQRQLKMKEHYVDSDQPKDQVVKVPDAGKMVDPGTSVTVDISRGNVVPVPNVVGLDVASAEAQLKNAGFNFQEVPGDTIPPGQTPKVQDQDKTGKAKSGTTIKITVEVVGDLPPTDNPTPTPTGTPTAGAGGGGLLD
jgi:eukaryotic-like serine/threonine-protein kinase